MQFHLDYILAVLIGGSVVLALAFTHATGQETAADATRFASSRSSANAIVEVLGQDLANVGAGVAAGQHRLSAPVGTAPTTQFEFSGIVSPTETAAVQRVRYVAVQRGSVAVEVAGVARTVPAYEVQRSVLNTTTNVWVPGGKSMPTVTDFFVEMQKADGARVTDPALAVQVLVRIAVASPLGQGADPNVVRWQRTYQIVT